MPAERTSPQLTYFVEFPPEWSPAEQRGAELYGMFSRPIRDASGDELPFGEWLASERSGISLAMSTLDPPTADTIQMLGEQGVPVTAWTVLDDEDGYWTNRSNMTKTVDKTWRVLEWAKDNNLKLEGVGLDIEKPLPYLSAFNQANFSAIRIAMRQYRAESRAEARVFDPVKKMENLIEDIKSENYLTETYVFPTALGKKLFGGMHVENADRTVEMDYLTVLPRALRFGGNALRLMLSDTAIPALGLINGVEGQTPGRDLSGKLPDHLTEAELATQMSIVLERRPESRDIYLFGLNHPAVAQMGSRALRAALADNVLD